MSATDRTQARPWCWTCPRGEVRYGFKTDAEAARSLRAHKGHCNRPNHEHTTSRREPDA